MKESKIFSEQNLTEKVHFVYRVTIDGKYYIGKRTGFLNDLHTGAYATSSKLVREKLQNGHHFSKIKILQVFPTEKEALEFERRFLRRVNAKANPKFLNQHNGNGNYTLKQHTEETKEKISKTKKAQFDENTEQGRKLRENASEKSKAQFDSNTEEGRQNRENMSEIKIEFYKTEQGAKNKENHSNKMKEYFNPDTEQGRFHIEENRRRGVERYNPDTEDGIKRREKQSQSAKAKFDINTEAGRKRRKEKSESQRNNWDENTERGRKLRENASEKSKAQFDENTEQGRKQREIQSEIQSKLWDENTEQGKKLRKNHSEFMKEYYNSNTEEGRKRREHMFNKRKEQTKEQLQKRQNASILGDLMFDEAFIRQNLLIIDDKNNLRFLSSVYSKLTGYSESHIIVLKREGKLSFLYGIKSIKLSEEDENTKIKEIEQLLKK